MRCVRADGTPAVLKLSPDPPFLAGQAEALRQFAPGGKVAAVLAADAGAGAVPCSGTTARTCPPTSWRCWSGTWMAAVVARHAADA
ncbi:MAG TPA: hypothetical protein VK586_01825 [Streptosporangiaceae bacterium]|nr:hypothetical protein [Streptosporangiaceae bacterium]